MESIKNKILSLKDPQLVADFQKLCLIDIFPESVNHSSSSSDNSSSCSPAAVNSEVYNRLHKTNGFVKSELISNGNTHQNCTNELQKEENSTKEKDTETPSEVKFNVKSKFLFWMFRCGAELGNEFFYLTFFTFCVWNLNCLITRQMAIIWHAGMFFGQAIKDVICIPRPASPPCARLEKRYEEEYGMPSTHATVGVIIPFGLLIIAHRHYEFGMILPLMFATFWTFVCGLSRIYLGMHSVLDVIVGALIGIVTIPIMLPYVEVLDKFQTTSPFGAPAVLAGSFFLLYMYPEPPVWNTAKGDTATVSAVGTGISVGSWINYQLGLGFSKLSTAYEVQTLTISWLGLSLLRSAIGVFILVIIRAIAKPASIALCCRYYNVDKNDVETQRKIGMEKPQKFIAYFTVGIGGLVIVPLILQYIGIMRMSYYSEF